MPGPASRLRTSCVFSLRRPDFLIFLRATPMNDIDHPVRLTAIEAAAVICEAMGWPLNSIYGQSPTIGYETASDAGLQQVIVMRIPSPSGDRKIELLPAKNKWSNQEVMINGRVIMSERRAALVRAVLHFYMAQEEGVPQREPPGLFVVRHGLYRQRRKFPYVFG